MKIYNTAKTACLLLAVLQLTSCGTHPAVAAGLGGVDTVFTSIDAQPETLSDELSGQFLPGWEGSGALRRFRTESGGYAVGLTEIDGESYYFGWDGFIRPGWIETDEDGRTVWRYAGSDGTLADGLTEIGGEWYWFEDCEMVTGWIETDDGRMYAGEDGALVRNGLAEGQWMDGDGYAIPETFTPDPELMEQVDAVINSCPDGISVVFSDLVSGQRWSWNETRSYYIASVFKLPYSLWLFERADAGEIDLDMTIPFTAENHRGNAGIIQFTEYGTLYSLHELIADALIYSDNTALEMLKSEFSPDDFDQWINTDRFGLTAEMSDSTDTMTNASDCCTFAGMAFEYMESGAEHADEFAASYCASEDRLIESELLTGQKYGWWENALHTASVIYADRPFAIAICTNWEARTPEDEANIQAVFDAVCAVFSGVSPRRGARAASLPGF